MPRRLSPRSGFPGDGAHAQMIHCRVFLARRCRARDGVRASAYAGDASRNSLTGSMQQGGLVVGKTEIGAKVSVDGKSVQVSPEGLFAFGFAYDHTAPADHRRADFVRWQFGNKTGDTDCCGITTSKALQVCRQKFVTPPPEDLRAHEGRARAISPWRAGSILPRNLVQPAVRLAVPRHSQRHLRQPAHSERHADGAASGRGRIGRTSGTPDPRACRCDRVAIAERVFPRRYSYRCSITGTACSPNTSTESEFQVKPGEQRWSRAR